MLNSPHAKTPTPTHPPHPQSSTNRLNLPPLVGLPLPLLLPSKPTSRSRLSVLLTRPPPPPAPPPPGPPTHPPPTNPPLIPNPALNPLLSLPSSFSPASASSSSNSPSSSTRSYVTAERDWKRVASLDFAPGGGLRRVEGRKWR